MLSTRSSCERTLFKKDLARFWPLSTAYTVLWFLLIPLEVFSKGERLARSYSELNMTGWAGNKALEQVCTLSGPIFSACYGVLCAMAVWSYLYNTRAVNMTHALPVRREGHFAAHFLSGAAMFTLPHVVIFLLTALAGAARGSTGDLGRIAAAMGILTLLCLFFFCFATLCAFVTGHILALPILYGIFNFLVYGVTELVKWLSGKFLFGLDPALRVTLDFVEWLTPVVKLSGELGCSYHTKYGSTTMAAYIALPEDAADAIGYTVTQKIEGLHLVFIYAAVGLVFAALALLLYRRRHLETAGDVIAVPWLRPVFQYGVAFCAAMAGTYITVDILSEDGPVVLTALLAVWGIVGYFIARMFLHKTLKVFRSGWKGAAATAAVLLALCAGLWVDVLGIERRVPDAGQVAAIYISGPESYPGDNAYFPHLTIDDPAQIEQILNIHRAIVAHRAELKDAQSSWTWDSEHTSTSLHMMYYTQAGDDFPFMERYYSRLVLSEEELNDPDSVAYALNEYISDPDVIRAAYELDDVEPGRMTQVVVDGLYRDGLDHVEYVTLYSPLSDYAATTQANEDRELFYSDQPMSAMSAAEPAEGPVYTWSERYQPAAVEELRGLWDAVLADFGEGALGRRWLFDTDEYEENTCLTTLEFYYQKKLQRPGQEDYYRQYAVSIQLTPQARHTLAAMEELGLFEDGSYVLRMGGDPERVYPN